MNINDIKSALAAKASSMNIEPIKLTNRDSHPITESDTKPSATTKSGKPTSKKSTSSKTSRPSKSKEASDSIEDIVSRYLIPGTDYNTIPGCGRKPALLKAGAEKLAAIFNYRCTSHIIHRIEQFDNHFVLYEVETTIFDESGTIISVGLGSCNSKERKYQRTDFSGNLNTILKMAKKRSYVDAILTACHGSGVFTQDIEDIAGNIQPVPNTKEA